jgi:multidrug efflux system membrane fusion protein
VTPRVKILLPCLDGKPAMRHCTLEARRTALLLLGIAGSLGGCSHPTAAVVEAPVTIAVAARSDVPIALTGLGRASGFFTASARAQTSGLITSLSFVEGDTVTAGQPLAQIDPRPLQAQLAQDEAVLARDRATLAGARDVLERTIPLVAQGLASAQQLVAYRTQVAQWEASVSGDRAVVARDRLSLAYATIRAPIAGVTGVRAIDPGNLVSPNDPAGIVTIAQVQPISVLFNVPQNALPAIQAALAQSAGPGLTVEAFASGPGGKLDAGRLRVINNRIDDGSGTIQLKAVFPNANKRIWPGQQIVARLIVGRSADAIMVPAAAIQRNPAGAFVWLVDGASKVRLQPVTTGTAIGDRIMITSGLHGGEKVVIDGQFGLTAGRKVTVATTGAAPATAHTDDPDRLGISL